MHVAGDALPKADFCSIPWTGQALQTINRHEGTPPGVGGKPGTAANIEGLGTAVSAAGSVRPAGRSPHGCQAANPAISNNMSDAPWSKTIATSGC